MPVVVRPNRLSTVTAAVDFIKHSHTLVYSSLLSVSVPSSWMSLSSALLLFKMLLPVFFHCLSSECTMYCLCPAAILLPSLQSKALENRLDWSSPNEWLAVRQVITGHCISPDGCLSSSVFVSYITTCTLFLICWTFAWIRHAHGHYRCQSTCCSCHRGREKQSEMSYRLRECNREWRRSL